MRKLSCLAFLLFLALNVQAQLSRDQLLKYLRTDRFAIDTEASAIVLYENNNQIINSLKLTKTIHKYIKVLRKDALNNGNIRVFWEMNSADNYIYRLKARTYNIDGDSIKVSELPGSDIYQAKVNKNIYEFTLAMPDVKAGSIIEYSYDLVSGYYDLVSWEIQDEYPKLVCEFALNYPISWSYASIFHPEVPIKLCKTKDSAINSGAPLASFAENTSVYHYSFWSRKNVSAIRHEALVNNPNNYIERMDLQHSKQSNWVTFDKYLRSIDGAEAAKMENQFLDGTLEKLYKSTDDTLARVRAIFKFVRDNIKVNSNSKTNDRDLRSILYDREGSMWQINYLLIAMLSRANISAYPLYVATTANPSADEKLPLFGRFNRVICAVKFGEYTIFLDGAAKHSPFGMLPVNCYNGYARLIAEKTSEDYFLTNDLLENKNRKAITIRWKNDSTVVYEIAEKIGLVESAILRNSLSSTTNGAAELLEKRYKTLLSEGEVANKQVLNLENVDTNIIVRLTIEKSMEAPLSVYPTGYTLSLSSNTIIQKNPFPAVARFNPVELPYRSVVEYFLNIQMPEGYNGASLPESVEMPLGDNMMNFKRTVQYNKEANLVTISSSFSENATSFSAANYTSLREYFSDVLKEENHDVTIKRR